MKPNRYRWVVVGVFFAFMLLHQSDKLLIGPLTTPIMNEFAIDEAQMGAVGTGALIVGAVLYPLWGYLYDRFARARLIALASAIWGATTWLAAIARSYGAFLVARASTGIDDSSYPGLYSLISDYFGPGMRGKIYGLLQLAQPLGYMVGLTLALMLAPMIGWRNVFIITGSIGLILAVVIFFTVREMPRGKGEPELAELAEIGIYRFNLKLALGLFRKRTLIPLFIQGFFGVFPWTVISFWMFRYLEVERGYASGEVLIIMVLAVLTLAGGYMVGGALGDFMFKRNPRGRLLVCTFGVFTGAIMLFLTLNIPAETVTGVGVDLDRTAAGDVRLLPLADRPAALAGIRDGDLLRAVNGVPVTADSRLEDIERQLRGALNDQVEVVFARGPQSDAPGELITETLSVVTINVSPSSENVLFLVMLCLTALLIPFSAPNVISTVYDITLPEVRSTALAVQYFIENAGAAFAPLIAGAIAVQTSLGYAIVLICVSAWIVGGLFLIAATIVAPRDIRALRAQMQARADEARAAR